MFVTRFVPSFRQASRKYSVASTLSEDELRKFSNLANEWWDLNGPFSGLHSLNKLRYAKKS